MTGTPTIKRPLYMRVQSLEFLRSLFLVVEVFVDPGTTQQCGSPKHPSIPSLGLTWARHPSVSTRQFPKPIMEPNLENSKGVG